MQTWRSPFAQNIPFIILDACEYHNTDEVDSKFHLCVGLVPRRERRREGRDGQMARSRSGGIDCISGSIRKGRCAEKDCVGTAI
jgi:hypothetical protein